jgi:hypothetical protein
MQQAREGRLFLWHLIDICDQQLHPVHRYLGNHMLLGTEMEIERGL